MQKLAELGVTCTSFDTLLLQGQYHPEPAAKATRQDLCTIMFSSGTTGTPKVVNTCILHQHVLSQVHWSCRTCMVYFMGRAYTVLEPYISVNNNISFEPGSMQAGRKICSGLMASNTIARLA